ncbi:hypothetical protein BJ322DRAFT_847519 [Thelephora terrestris]|uniref:Uncharacterized protein n=1 Tax=Thelephora terrestris TaxID=56493 RepID=A0A9P6HDC5_9AGAM|nr:hypothetical protein BJ322DRAFT_847519 [Thelephora terrestris]
MIRAIIVWSYSRCVIGLLLLLLIGQWTLVFVGLHVGTVQWNRLLGACVPTDSQTRSIILVGAFSVYTAGLDLIIALLTVLGARQFGRDRFATLLQRQGIQYFLFIIIVHTITVALVFYDPNSLIGVYGALAAVVFSPIIACRLVRAVFDLPSQIRRGTTQASYISPLDTSRSSRSAPQEPGMQLATQIHRPRSEMEDDEMEFPTGKGSRGVASSIVGTTADSV